MSTPRPRVLIVEDDRDMRSVLVAVLGPAYEIAIADNGETALWRFDAGERFDVVICDVLMPRIDGAALVEHLSQIDAEQARRVIVLTGDPASSEAAQLSHYYVMEKPFNVRELRELIARVTAAAHDGYFPTPLQPRG